MSLYFSKVTTLYRNRTIKRDNRTVEYVLKSLVLPKRAEQLDQYSIIWVTGPPLSTENIT